MFCFRPKIRHLLCIVFIPALLSGAPAAHASLHPPLDIEPDLLLPPKPAVPHDVYTPPPGAKPYEGAELAFSPQRFKKYDDRATAVLFSPDSRLVALQGPDTVEVIDIQSGSGIASYRPGRKITAMAFSPDGMALAVGTSDRNVHIFARDGGETLLEGSTRAQVASLAYSETGSRLAVGYSDGHIELWDPAFRERDAMLKGHKKLVHSLAFLPGQDQLVSVGEDLLTKFWDLNTRKETRSFQEPEHRLTLASLSADGALIALNAKVINIDVMRNRRTDERFLVVRETATGEEVRRFKLPKDVSSIAFHPNRRYLASASGDGVIRIFDIRKGEEVNNIQVTSDVSSLDMSLDGSMLVYTGRNDVTIMKLQ